MARSYRVIDADGHVLELFQHTGEDQTDAPERSVELRKR